MKSKERNATEIFGRLVQRNKAVSEFTRVRSLQPGEMVTADEMSQSVFLVASGRVQLHRTTRDGRGFVIATLGPGSIFGEESLLGGQGPDTSAVALEPCTIWVMPGQEALDFSTNDAMFGFGLMQAMGQRVMEAENRLEQVAYSTIASRLAALLLDLSSNDPQGAVHATHQELAQMLGTWRETISKTLQDFRLKGWVSSGRRHLRILDRESLEEEAGGL